MGVPIGTEKERACGRGLTGSAPRCRRSGRPTGRCSSWPSSSTTGNGTRRRRDKRPVICYASCLCVCARPPISIATPTHGSALGLPRAAAARAEALRAALGAAEVRATAAEALVAEGLDERRELRVAAAAAAAEVGGLAAEVSAPNRVLHHHVAVPTPQNCLTGTHAGCDTAERVA